MTRISAIEADLTTLEVGAIVNAANTHLQHGGGVALAIARAGGQIIQDASDAWIRDHGPLSPGIAAITPAGSLPSRVVIHVAGPRFRDGRDNEGLLRKAVVAALDAAAEQKSGTVAMPAISAGIYGYPLEEATRVIAATTRAWCDEYQSSLSEVLLVGFDAKVTEAFQAALD